TAAYGFGAAGLILMQWFGWFQPAASTDLPWAAFVRNVQSGDGPVFWQVFAQSLRASTVGYHYFADSAIILTLITLGKYLEAAATGRASRAILRLLDLAPARARVLRDGTEVEVPAVE